MNNHAFFPPFLRYIRNDYLTALIANNCKKYKSALDGTAGDYRKERLTSELAGWRETMHNRHEVQPSDSFVRPN